MSDPIPERFQHIQTNYGRLSLWLSRTRMQVARPYLTGRSVLDVGCNIADLAGLVPPAMTYVGMELVPEIVEIAEWRFPDREFVSGDAGAPWPTEVAERRFDHVTMLAILEHLKDPVAALRQARLVLNPGGTVIATTPHTTARRIHAFGARIGLFSRDADEEHEAFYDRAGLGRMAEAAGLKVIEYRPFQFGLNQLVVFGAGERAG